MFENLTVAAPDAIFGLNEAMRRDPRPGKINLGAGVYKDEQGRTPVLAVVKAPEKHMLEHEPTKSYLPIDGLAAYGERVRELHFGAGHEALAAGRAVTAQTPDGTGALRVAGDFIRRIQGEATVWMSDPTWINHQQVFSAVGLRQKSYTYFDPETNGLAFDRMIDALADADTGDLVLLHGCCHNPTGVDPSPE